MRIHCSNYTYDAIGADLFMARGYTNVTLNSKSKMCNLFADSKREVSEEILQKRVSTATV